MEEESTVPPLEPGNEAKGDASLIPRLLRRRRKYSPPPLHEPGNEAKAHAKPHSCGGGAGYSIDWYI